MLRFLTWRSQMRRIIILFSIRSPSFDRKGRRGRVGVVRSARVGHADEERATSREPQKRH